VDTLPGGDRLVRFRQHVGGVPVLGGELVVTVNRAGLVVSAVGETPVDRPTATQARVSAATAGRNGLRAAAVMLGLSTAELAVGETSLWLYDPRMIGAPGPGRLRPNWLVRVEHEGLTVPAATAFIDATDGSTSLVYSEVKFSRNRLVCDLANTRVNLNTVTTYRCDTAAGGPAVARTEGGPASGIADVNAAHDFLGDTYKFYQRRVGRDSIDGRGMQLRATVRACHTAGTCPYANAFWDGAQMVFGAGYATDDVVGHELTHGVTDFTSQLFYAFQSGAINEALSDIMGEFIDQTNGKGTDNATTKWQIGEDLPDGVLRDMEDPAAPLGGLVCDDPNDQDFPPGCQPDRVGSPLYTLDPFFLDNGGVHINSGIANKAAYLLAEPGSHTFNGRTVTGIGLDKSVQLWYRVMLGMTSGGDYEDLGTLLQTSCRRLVGNLGFAAADCLEVDDAVAATEMITVHASGTEEAGMCDSAGMPIQDVFFDGFEAGASRWTLGGRAGVAPTAIFPFRWAHSGVNAMYLNSEQAPPSSIVMKNFVSVPATGTTYLWFAHLPFSGKPRVRIFNGTTTTEIAFDAGWNVPPRTGWGPETVANGYVSTRFDLSAFAGQNVKITFVEDPQPGNIGEWFIDDVHLYQCVNRVGAVRNLAGPRDESRTTATLTWDAPLFAGPGVTGYEVSVSPAVDGYPRVLPPGPTAHTITGLSPTRIYTVSVRALGATGAGEPAVLRLDLLRFVFPYTAITCQIVQCGSAVMPRPIEPPG
jgi:Zn-dependent metalloprotease